ANFVIRRNEVPTVTPSMLGTDSTINFEEVVPEPEVPPQVPATVPSPAPPQTHGNHSGARAAEGGPGRHVRSLGAGGIRAGPAGRQERGAAGTRDPGPAPAHGQLAAQPGFRRGAGDARGPGGDPPIASAPGAGGAAPGRHPARVPRRGQGDPWPVAGTAP